MSWLTSDDSVRRYVDALKRAASDDVAFNHFRRERGVRDIIEGIPDVAGFGYYAKLKDTEFFKQNLERIQKNDEVGNPHLVLFDGRPLASTTLRYAWNVFDMRRNGVQLDRGHIVEVGGGYGGLCRMVCEFHDHNSYTIIDIPEALELAKRYLAQFELHPKFVSCFEYETIESITTFISNYALTELTKDLQDGYVNAFMKHAPSGYVTYNSQPRNILFQHSLNDLLGMVPATSEPNIIQENIKKSECQVLVWRPR